MNEYNFFTAQLRFAATKTQRNSDDIDQMMKVLSSIAEQIDTDKSFHVEAKNLRIGARALAGIAGFCNNTSFPKPFRQKILLVKNRCDGPLIRR